MEPVTSQGTWKAEDGGILARVRMRGCDTDSRNEPLLARRWGRGPRNVGSFCRLKGEETDSPQSLQKERGSADILISA